MSKVFTRNFTSIFIIAFLLYLCINMTQPILPRYLDSMQVSTVAIGFISSLFALVALCMRPFSGQIVDHEKKKKVLIFSIVIVLFSMIGYYIAVDYKMIGFFRGLHGFAWAFGSTVCMTIAVNTLDKDHVAEGIGVYGLGQILAAALAPSIGIAIADAFGYQTLFLCTVGFASIALLLACFIQVKETPSKQPYAFKLNNIIAKEALLPSALTMCNQLIYGALSTFLILFGESINVFNVSFFFTIYSLSILISRVFITRLSKRIGAFRTIVLCEISIVIGMVVIFFAQSIGYFLVAGVCIGLGFSGAQPLLMSESVRCVREDRRGVASSTNYIGTDIGMFLGSYATAYLVNLFGYNVMFLLVPLPLVLGLLVWKRRYHA
ncbi:MAG: MFS transporter [Erysipelotrichaceae bacterium]